MASKRITMQDIADACGLSRNTVSKVFNQRGAVPQATRDTVLRTARELGYGVPSAERAADAPARSIALLTAHMPRDYHFAIFFFPSFTEQVTSAGYTLRMFEVSREDVQRGRLPPHFSREETAGILGIELFDPAYVKLLCAMDLPALFIDSPVGALYDLMPCDFVSMENTAGMLAVTERLIRDGAKTVGFVGDKEHCGSFFERWLGYSFALDHAHIPLDERLCILAPDSPVYGDPAWFRRQIEAMPRRPDAFVCANDFIALHLMTALKQMGLSIPGDVMVAGFDNIPESAIVEPALTTVSIPSAEIGRVAASVLLSRIRRPNLPYTWTRVKTAPVFRRTTR